MLTAPPGGGRGKRRPPAPVFVGRRDLLAAFAEELTRVAKGEPRAVWVVGDSGIGKTALVRKVLGDWQDGSAAPMHRVIWLSGDESETSLPFGLLSQAPDALGLGAEVLPETLVASSPERADADPMAVGLQILAALAAPSGPTVLVADDLQWADAPSASALLFAMRRLRVEPVLAVLVTRPDPGAHLGESWARYLANPERVRTLAVPGLATEEIAELSAALGDRLDVAAAERLRDHTSGHPLHARVLLDELGVTAIAGVDGVLPAPRSLAALTLAKVATLGPAAQRLIEAGAVLGTVFPLPVGARVAGSDDPLPGLEEAMAAAVLERLPSGDVAFAHPLLRGAVYNDLSPTRRSQLHAAAADATSGVTSLLHRASAVGGADAGIAARLEALADEDLRAGHAARAAERLQRAAVLSPEPAEHDRRLLRSAEALFTGNYHARVKAMRAAIEACGDRPERSWVLGLLELISGRFELATQLLADAGRSPTAGPIDIRPRALGGLAFALFMRGAYDEALAAVSEALAGDLGWGAGVSRYVQAMCLMQLGRDDELRAVLGDLEDEGPAAIIPSLDVLGGRGLLKFVADDLEGAHADLTAVARRASAGEPARFLTASLSFLSDVEYRFGLWDDAAIHADLAVSLATDAEQMMGLLFARAAATYVHAGRGDFTVAEEHAAAADAMAVLFPTMGGRMLAATARAVLAQARGDAEAMYRAASDLLQPEIRMDLERMRVWRWRALVVEALIGVGRIEEAGDALARLVGFAEKKRLRSAAVDVALLRGWLAEAGGDLREALSCYEGGRAAGSVSPLTMARLETRCGALLRRIGEPRAAVGPLRSAREILVRLGAVPFLAPCDAELAACGLRQGDGADRHVLSLTSREAAVAHLVAEGLSNREVATRLYVSAKAVEYHLSNIYAKLGISSRRQLPRRLQGRRPGDQLPDCG